MKRVLVVGCTMFMTASMIAQQKQEPSRLENYIFNDKNTNKVFLTAAITDFTAAAISSLLLLKNLTSSGKRFHLLKLCSLAGLVQLIFDGNKLRIKYNEYQSSLKNTSSANTLSFAEWLKIEKKKFYPYVAHYLACSVWNLGCIGLWCWFLHKNSPHALLLKSSAVISELLMLAALFSAYTINKGVSIRTQKEKR